MRRHHTGGAASSSSRRATLRRSRTPTGGGRAAAPGHSGTGAVSDPAGPRSPAGALIARRRPAPTCTMLNRTTSEAMGHFGRGRRRETEYLSRGSRPHPTRALRLSQQQHHAVGRQRRALGRRGDRARGRRAPGLGPQGLRRSHAVPRPAASRPRLSCSGSLPPRVGAVRIDLVGGPRCASLGTVGVFRVRRSPADDGPSRSRDSSRKPAVSTVRSWPASAAVCRSPTSSFRRRPVFSTGRPMRHCRTSARCTRTHAPATSSREHNLRLTEEQFGMTLPHARVVRNPFLVPWALRSTGPPAT